VTDERSLLVGRSYDLIAEEYAAWGGTEAQGAKRRYLSEALGRSTAARRLLDLGCGTGQHVTRHLAAVAPTVGVDLSPRSLALAKSMIPTASFVRADMADVAFAERSFDGVVAFFSLIHVPRERHELLLRAIHSWLRPGGFLIVTMHAGGGEHGEGELLGVPMFWSGWSGEQNAQLVEAVGFRCESVVDETEPENDALVTHRWIVATAR
jgi:SAM-dependent methyltransferase